MTSATANYLYLPSEPVVLGGYALLQEHELTKYAEDGRISTGALKLSVISHNRFQLVDPESIEQILRLIGKKALQTHGTAEELLFLHLAAASKTKAIIAKPNTLAPCGFALETLEHPSYLEVSRRLFVFNHIEKSD